MNTIDYLAHNANAKVGFQASDMIMNIHLQLHMWLFLHGVDAKRWRPNKNQWGVSHHREHSLLCGGVHHRS